MRRSTSVRINRRRLSTGRRDCRVQPVHSDGCRHVSMDRRLQRRRQQLPGDRGVRRHQRNSHRHHGDARDQHDRVGDGGDGRVVDGSSNRHGSGQSAPRWDDRLPVVRTERRDVRGHARVRVAGSRLPASRRARVVNRVHTDHNGHLPMDCHLQRRRQQRRSDRCLQHQHCRERQRVADTADTRDSCRTGHAGPTRRSTRGRRAIHAARHRVGERTVPRIRGTLDSRWYSARRLDPATTGTGVSGRRRTRAAGCRR